MPSLPVYCAAIKLIIEVPSAHTIETFPEKAVISPQGQNNLNPAVVVQNAVDDVGTWQGADGEKGVIVIDDITEKLAQTVLDMLGREYSQKRLKAVLSFLEGAGFNQQRTSTKEFVDKNYRPCGIKTGPYTGVYTPESNPIIFVSRDQFGVIWCDDGNNISHIKEHVLLTFYRHVRGGVIHPDDIPFG